MLCIWLDNPEIFCDGINQPLRSQLRREGPRSSLSCFLDFALLTVGSLFTVGVADEDRVTASMTEMVDAPECAHKMAATAEPVHKMAATTTPRHVSAASHESIQVKVDVKEPSRLGGGGPLGLRAQGPVCPGVVGCRWSLRACRHGTLGRLHCGCRRSHLRAILCPFLGGGRGCPCGGSPGGSVPWGAPGCLGPGSFPCLLHALRDGAVVPHTHY